MSSTALLEPVELPASRTLFLRRFLKHGKRVASIAPSSSTLARKTCQHVSPDVPQVILELGAGTGAITRVACQTMHPDSRLIAVEIDPHFADVLERTCPRAHVIRCDVRDIDRHLDDLDVPSIDVLLNGLPTPSLPRSVNQIVLDTFAKRSRDAWFSQITVMPWVYQPLYERLFKKVTFQLVARNLPPGGVYHCRKLKPDYALNVPGTKKAHGLPAVGS